MPPYYCNFWHIFARWPIFAPLLWASAQTTLSSFYRYAIRCNATHDIAKAFLSVRPSVCPSIYLSVGLSVKCVDYNRTKKNLCLHFYTTRKTVQRGFWQGNAIKQAASHSAGYTLYGKPTYSYTLELKVTLSENQFHYH